MKTALPYDPGNKFTPGGPSDMVTAVLANARQMAVTIRTPGTTLTVLLDKPTGQQWAANITEAAAMLAEPAGGSANGRPHAHG